MSKNSTVYIYRISTNIRTNAYLCRNGRCIRTHCANLNSNGKVRRTASKNSGVESRQTHWRLLYFAGTVASASVPCERTEAKRLGARWTGKMPPCYTAQRPLVMRPSRATAPGPTKRRECILPRLVNWSTRYVLQSIYNGTGIDIIFHKKLLLDYNSNN